MLNNGSGGFTAAPSISWTNASNAAKIVVGDFNRDCATDLAVIRSDSVAVLTGNNTGNFTLTSIASSSAPVSLAVADFNLDRKSDLAFGRLNSTVIVAPGDGAGGFGSQFTLTASAIPDFIAPLDINLDGKADLALSQRSGVLSVYNGSSNLFLRTENDYDADGMADLSVFLPSTGDWYIQRSVTPQGSYRVHWGISTDKPVPADYDGDFKTDIAVWRENGFGDPNRSYFFIFRSSDNTLQQEQFGRTGDVPTVVGDWDGDGRADVAVYRNGANAGAQSFFFFRPSGTPGADFNGWDYFTFVANDGVYDSNEATVNFWVWEVNDAPVAQDLQIAAGTDPVSGQVVAIDPEGDWMYYDVESLPEHGTVVFDAEGGIFTYTPQADYTGYDHFTWVAYDWQLQSNVATVEINPQLRP